MSDRERTIMAKEDAQLRKMREICLSLPDTKLTMTWGQPHFRVMDKIFAGYGAEKGKQVIGFKLEMDHADAILADARFTRAPYVGHKGWVSLDATQVDDWNEVKALILESYRLIAPKRSLAKLASGTGPKKSSTREQVRRARVSARGAGKTARKVRAATRARSGGRSR
jgi:predicted DNA-binding protein (MmcQ/YjbR family)